MPAAPKPISDVDVVKQLELKAKGTGLNWKVSIVDLLTLLDIDHSREARNELAKELGCPPEFMSDSAKMNTWLHKTVLHKIAENGGNIPQGPAGLRNRTPVTQQRRTVLFLRCSYLLGASS